MGGSRGAKGAWAAGSAALRRRGLGKPSQQSQGDAVRRGRLLSPRVPALPAVVFQNESAITGLAVGAVLAAVAAFPTHNGRSDNLGAATVAEVHAVGLRHLRLPFAGWAVWQSSGRSSGRPWLWLSLPRFFDTQSADGRLNQGGPA